MDDKLIRKIQKEGAEALLDRGVSLPLFDLRIPFKKMPLHVRVTMKRPTLARQICIAREYLSMNITAEKFEKLDYEEQMAFLVRHGKTLGRILALTLDSRWVPTFLLTWVVCHFVKWEYQREAFVHFVLLMGTQSFLTIIRSVELSNPMKLRLSRKRKGS